MSTAATAATTEDDPLYKARPWHRWAARIIDINLMIVLASALFTIEVEGKARDVAMMLLGTWLLVGIESVLLFAIGTTPGKWLFNIFVVPVSGNKLSLFTAFTRSLEVCIRGTGGGLPLVIAVTSWMARNHLLYYKLTKWDEHCGTLVEHRPLSVGRKVLIGGVLVLLVLIHLSASS